MKESCLNCKFYVQEEDSCHRYAPSPLMGGNHAWKFPRVFQTGETPWCGDWKMKPDAQPQT